MLIDINKIKTENRIRKDFGDISELAADISANGLINPPVVIPEPDGTYTLLAGERRLKAMKSLGYHQIEVRTWKNLTEEEKLNIEISENEVRKDFSKAERIEYARKLERIEAEKARERMSDGGKGVQNFAQAKTRNTVASKLGIGSGETYRKEKYIVDNKDHLPPEDFADWDEGKLSTNKAYNKIKKEYERLKLESENLHNLTKSIPGLEDWIDTGIAPTSTVLALVNSLSPQEKEKIFPQKSKEIPKLKTQDDYIKKLQDSALVFCARVSSFIEQVGGFVWLTDKINEVPELERKGYIDAVHTVKSWADTMEYNLNNNIKEIK